VGVLTSLYYFGHYRNFVARATPGGPNAGGFAKRAWPAENLAPRSLGADSAVLLNTADNSRVVDYARTLSSSIVSLKDAAKMFVHDVNTIERNGNITFESHLQWIEEDLESFIKSYNNVQHLSATGLNNGALTHFAHYFRDFAQSNSQVLSHLGVITYSGANLTYHGLANTATREAARDAVDTFKSAYNMTRGFLQHPLTHHMNFRDLSYYYNYTIGDVGTITFSIVQSVLLVDILI